MNRSVRKQRSICQGAPVLLERIGREGVESALRVLWPRRHGSAGDSRVTRALIRVDLSALRLARQMVAA